MTQEEKLVELLRDAVATAEKKSLRNRFPKKGFVLIAALALAFPYWALSEKTPNNPNYQVLKEQYKVSSVPQLMQTHIIYKDPICSDNLIVTYNGKPICGAI